MDDAVVGLIGAVVGAGIGAGALLLGLRLESDQRRDEAVREACAEFSAALIRIRYLSEGLPARSGSDRVRLIARIESSHEEAQVQFERLRLLSESLEIQEAGRFALRHMWAIWKEAETGEDPRAAEFADRPLTRFNARLTALYIAVRRETRIKHPERVFPEPDD